MRKTDKQTGQNNKPSFLILLTFCISYLSGTSFAFCIGDTTTLISNSFFLFIYLFIFPAIVLNPANLQDWMAILKTRTSKQCWTKKQTITLQKFQSSKSLDRKR